MALHAPGVARLASERQGTTIAEMVAVLVLTAVVLAIAIPRMRHGVERAAVRGAVAELVSTLSTARQLAASGGGPVALSVDSTTASVYVTRRGDTLVTRALGQLFGVTLRASRDSLAYDPRGLGLGASNLTFVIVRGITTDTVVVSRLGRVRW